MFCAELLDGAVAVPLDPLYAGEVFRPGIGGGASGGLPASGNLRGSELDHRCGRRRGGRLLGQLLGDALLCCVYFLKLKIDSLVDDLGALGDLVRGLVYLVVVCFRGAVPVSGIYELCQVFRGAAKSALKR